MDRELALDLAERRDPIIVQSAPTVVNVSYQVPVSSSGSMATLPDGSPDDRKNCRSFPVYTATGQLDHFEKQCYGGN